MYGVRLNHYCLQSTSEQKMRLDCRLPCRQQPPPCPVSISIFAAGPRYEYATNSIRQSSHGPELCGESMRACRPGLGAGLRHQPKTLLLRTTEQLAVVIPAPEYELSCCFLHRQNLGHLHPWKSKVGDKVPVLRGLRRYLLPRPLVVADWHDCIS